MATNKNIKSEYVIRPPIVTVMGHVDHGKTSILDAIRKTNVAGREYAGITQHIGAYQVEYNSKLITFIDTPGHEAFAQMRARGGKVCDIVVLVVAANEGVKPQTKEAISHAKASKAPIIVAINKVDLPDADVQKVKQQLSMENIQVEDWGGNVVSVELSAKTGKNVDKLLEAILAVAELSEIKAYPEGELEATVIESKIDKKKGVLVSAIVRNGILRIGMDVSVSGYFARVRSLVNDKAVVLKEAGPSTPVEILGFKEVPSVGDIIVEKGSELAQLAVDENRIEIIGADTKRTVGIIVRADTQGTLEAVKSSLARLVSENVASTYSLKFLLTATGDVNDSDVLLASNTKSVIVGFNVSVLPQVSSLAEEKGVQIRTYKTIYELIDDVKAVLEGTAFKEEAKIKGRAEILKTFTLPSKDVVIGCKILAGALKNTSRVYIFDKNPDDLTKEDLPLYVGHIKKLKIGKDDVSVVGKDNECGILLKPQFLDAKPGYFIEVR